MDPFTSDLLDGIFGRYTFLKDFTNVLYGDKPTFGFILGELFLFGIIFLLTKSAVKDVKNKVAMISKQTKNIWKEVWIHKKRVTNELTILVLLPALYLYFAITNVTSTIRIYSEFSTPAKTFIEGKILAVGIQKGKLTGKSPYANINLLFVGDNDRVYSLHLVDGERRLANKLLNDEKDIYDAFIALDENGKVLYINEFATD